MIASKLPEILEMITRPMTPAEVVNYVNYQLGLLGSKIKISKTTLRRKLGILKYQAK
ncbi:MAG: hypothetical protein ACFFD4_38010 [Candidatus Odinarchaeota archaeon]